MSDIEWVDTEVAVSGLNELVDKRLMPPGQLVTARNAEFSTETISVRKRNGVEATVLTNGVDLPLQADRLVRFKNQLLMLEYKGGIIQPPSAYMPNERGQKWSSIEQIPVPIIERTPVTADLGGYVLTDTAIVQNIDGTYFNVYGMILYTSNTDSSKYCAIQVRVVEQISGSVVFEKVLLLPSREFDFIPVWVRLASSGDKVLMMVQYEQIIAAVPHKLGPTTLGWVINCSGSVPIVGPKFEVGTVTADSNTSQGLFEGHDPKFDLTGLAPVAGVPRWAMAYGVSNTGIPASHPMMRVVQLTGVDLGLGNYSTTETWNTRLGTWPAAISIISQTANGVEEIWLNWVDNCPPYVPDSGRTENADAWVYAVIRASDGSSILGMTVWDTNTGYPNPIHPAAAYWVSAIAPTNTAGKALLMKSQLDGPTTSDYTPFMRKVSWRGADAAGVMDDMMSHRGGDIVSKPWRDPVNLGWYYVWLATTYHRKEATFTSPVTYALMHIPEFNGVDVPPLSVATKSKVMLAASTLAERGVCIDHGLFATTHSDSPYHPGNSPMSSSPLFGSDTYHSVLPAQYIPGEDTSGPQDIEVSMSHLGRGSSVEFGGAAYIAGGTLMMWDGQRLSEVGFINPPALYEIKELDTVPFPPPYPTTSGWGTLGSSSVQYCAIFETVNAAGERTMSGISEIMTGTITDPLNSWQAVRIDHNLITRRYWTPEYNQVMPHVVVTLYRTAPGGTILKRIYQFDNSNMEQFISDPDAMSPILFIDNGSGELSPNTVLGHEVLYGGDPIQTEGELGNDMPVGGCTCLCVHKDRLWVGGCDDPEIIWYSKERADDRTAEFSVGQQIRLPGRRVVALGSLGDALIVFCERGIFAIFGEGPNAQGNPQSGQFSEPVNISSTQGCTSPRSVIQFPEGILFHNNLGIHLLDRKHNIQFFGQYVWRTTEKYPVVKWVKMVEDTKQVRFGLANLDDTDGTVLVYDWAIEVWTEWKHTCANYWVDAEGWTDHEFSYLAPTGYLFSENPNLWFDGSYPYYEVLETGWLSFGRIQGYKRIHRIGLLLERLGAHGLDVEIAFDYNDGKTVKKSWSASELTKIGIVEWLRIKLAKKTPAIKIKLTETPNGLMEIGALGAGFALQSFAFELGMVPGMNRLPAVQSR